MKALYWAFVVIGLVLVVVGHFANYHWLVFVAIAVILAGMAVDPKRSLSGRRKSS